MVETKLTRLNKVLREFNISLDRAVEYLSSKGHDVEARPTTKISQDQYNILLDEFQSDKTSKVESHDLSCLLYTSPSPRDKRQSRMPSSA